MKEDVRVALRRFSAFCRKHDATDEPGLFVSVFAHNADDVDAALAHIDTLTAERDALRAQVERVRAVVAAADRKGAARNEWEHATDAMAARVLDALEGK